MKIGYPCVNNSLGCTSSKTFRLASYTPERFEQTVHMNLDCLQEILDWNVAHGIYFFRISSEIIPFASHPICTYPWQVTFANKLKKIGDYIRHNDIRITMHPDQFVLINSLSEEIFERSVKELLYHSELLDLMELDTTHKIQIHVGGVYGDKTQSIQRFISRYTTLPETIKKRLVIENDDRLFSLKDCLYIYEQTHIPILFDVFHHSILNNGEDVRSALLLAAKTWGQEEGVQMIDYSSQQANARTGKHTQHIDRNHFQTFLRSAADLNMDVMFEIKDKEKSIIQAKEVIKRNLQRAEIDVGHLL